MLQRNIRDAINRQTPVPQPNGEHYLCDHIIGSLVGKVIISHIEREGSAVDVGWQVH